MSGTAKRLRIIAGPNGSGKSSVFKELLKEGHPNFGIFVNADDIESTLKLKGILSFKDYGITVSEEEFQESFRKAVRTRNTQVEEGDFDVNDNFLVYHNKEFIDSYFAGIVAEFVRDKMLSSRISPITIETVMSHQSKLDVMDYARSLGYRVYLYYITTMDPRINLERVKIRTVKGGHDVPEEKIKTRYYRSLDNLYNAVLKSDRAFLIDNSGKKHELIAEYDKSINTLNFASNYYPEWVQKYFIDKNNSAE